VYRGTGGWYCRPRGFLPGGYPGNKSSSTVLRTGHPEKVEPFFAVPGIYLLLEIAITCMVARQFFFDDRFFWCLLLFFLGNHLREHWVPAVIPDVAVQSQHVVVGQVFVVPPESLVASIFSSPCNGLVFWFTVLDVEGMWSVMMVHSSPS
jgi:hypothetical protein